MFGSEVDPAQTMHRRPWDGHPSQFLAINDDDTRPIMIDTITVSHTDRYVYLGTPMSTKSIAAQVEDNLKSESGHMMKFLSFPRKNTDAHFSVKQTMWESAHNSANAPASTAAKHG